MEKREQVRVCLIDSILLADSCVLVRRRRFTVFNVMAGSVEEYFRFDPSREHERRAVDPLIRAAAPTLARWFVPGTWSAGHDHDDDRLRPVRVHGE